MTKSESLVFGLTWLTPFNAENKYKQNINIFVKFYYHDLTTKDLKETGFNKKIFLRLYFSTKVPE